MLGPNLWVGVVPAKNQEKVALGVSDENRLLLLLGGPSMLHSMPTLRKYRNTEPH